MSYDEIVIENALDLYDRYEITMEDAIGIAMEKLSAQDKLELRNAAVSGLRKGAKVGAGVGAVVGVGNGDATSLIGAPIAGALNGSLYGAGIGALKSYAKIRKRNLVKAAELERQAQEAEAKAAAKREEAENAVAQAKEAASYFAY